MAIEPISTDALLVVDMQNDFLPGGALAVADGDQIITPINALAHRFANVVLTQDWHPAEHISFASSHPGSKPYDTIGLVYGQQVLWPDHCVTGSKGAELSPRLDIPHAQLLIRKGYHSGVDSYSAFQEADRKTRTGLAGYLKERGLTRVFIVGLATDFCVAWTGLDARALGFTALMIEDLTRPIDANGSLARARSDLDRVGVKRVASSELS